MRWLVLVLALSSLALAACDSGGGDGTRSCNSLLDCRPGEVCRDGVCATASSQPCSVDGDCPAEHRCDDGLCVYDPDPPPPCSCEPDDPCTATTDECWVGDECRADGDCVSDNECVVYTCDRGICTPGVADIEGCCLADGDCDDGLECSVDTCVSQRCEHEFMGDCCTEDADCDDLDPCTEDVCHENECRHQSLGAACCQSDADCDDEDRCTVDQCVSGQCVHPRKAADPVCGCVIDEHCDDGNPCTQETCEGNDCEYRLVNSAPTGWACCASAADCDDGDLGTRELCVENVCVVEARVACTDTSECSGAFVCYEAVCTGGYCVETGEPLENCCVVAADCDDGDTCTEDECLATNRCRHAFVMGTGCCTNDAQCNDGLDCTSEFCCQQDQCCGAGGCVARSHCIYTITPGGDCCVNDTQCDDGSACTLDVCIDGSCYNEAIGSCCAQDSECDDDEVCTEDICNEAGGCENEPLPGCCHDVSECDDANPCTIDSCEENRCNYEWVEACCTEDVECNDDDVCTEDLCETNACVHNPISPCCITDSDCVTTNPCRQGTCLGDSCLYEDIPGCCLATADCDDSAACTQDFCISNRCSYLQANTPECCSPFYLYENDFEAGWFAVEDWSLQNSVTGVGWQVVDDGPTIATWPDDAALYYGDATRRSYTTGIPSTAHTGTARTPAISLTQDMQLFASFDSYVDIDPAGGVDTYELRVLSGVGFANATTVWTKDFVGGNSGGVFKYANIDLSPWRGQDVKLQFRFNSIVAPAVDREGIYVDNLRIGIGCEQMPVECTIDAHCATTDPCTVAACVDQTCEEAASDGPSCCRPLLFGANYDDGTPQGFSTGFLPGASTAFGWSPDGFRSFSPPNSFYFGDPIERAYKSGTSRVGGYADTEPLDLGLLARPLISFRFWADLDPVLGLDHLDVVIVELPTMVETVLWSTNQAIPEGTTDGEFDLVSLSLRDFLGKDVIVRFVFDTTDGFNDMEHEGVYIDDITIGEDCR